VLNRLLKTVSATQGTSPRVVEIPVCYGGEHGPDLEDVARTCGLSAAEVVELHSGARVDVMMLGFAPGHPYIGMFDEKLNPGRRATPRTAVAAGSIGLANRQTVIYPLTLPGGWNLIGRTPLVLFDPSRDAPCLVNAGDAVRFVPITAEQYQTMSQSAGVPR
jgi:KipI family sensor histidine kinase inhibitor